MKLASTIARVLLGLFFVASGIAGFLPLHVPPMPGMAGEFLAIYFASHWVQFVDSIGVACGLLLLINRFVPLALVMLAAVIANMFFFHIALQPAGLPAPLLLAVLWLFVALPLREHFAPLLANAPNSVYDVPPRSGVRMAR